MNGHPQLTKDVSFRFARSNDNRDEISDSGVFLMRFGSCADALALRSLVVLALMLVGTGLQASERKELGEILKQKYKGTPPFHRLGRFIRLLDLGLSASSNHLSASLTRSRNSSPWPLT